MSNEELVLLQNRLETRLSKWKMPRGLSTGELVADVMLTLWFAIVEGAVIQKPDRWLLGAAHRKRKEIFRQAKGVRFATPEQLNALSERKQDAKHGKQGKQTMQLGKSQMWNSLTSHQAFALTESLMFDRPVSAIASEIKVNRSTVKSWISRIPRRLATDTYFRSLPELKRS